MSARRRRSFSQSQRRNLLLLGLLLALLFWGLAVRPFFQREDLSGTPILISSSGPYLWDFELISQDTPSEASGLRLGGTGAFQVSLGDGTAESGEEYVERMVAALAHDGRLVRIFNSSSAVSTSGHWIARHDSVLLRTSDERLDALHLLSVRELDHDFITPYLIRFWAQDLHVFRVDISPAARKRFSAVPLLNQLFPREAGFNLEIVPDAGLDQAALLGEFQARGFVSAQD